MPFKAIDNRTEKIILSFEFESKFELKANHPLISCPVCKGKMFSRERNGFILHFVHNSKSENCPLSKGESWKHLEGKRIVYNILKNQISKLSEKLQILYSVDIEHRVKEVNRIIDVTLLCSNQPVEAHEIQISQISLSELESRTQDYSSQGIATYWYFEKNGSLTKEVQNWLLKNYGEVRYFEIETEINDI
ncbi:competence protein CoiA (plasmid) [Synechocystis sp. B12]|nr:competence protein CoiA [Synechocystis sp. B12]